MKRTILSITACLTFGAFQAQVNVISDDFEGYQTGNYIAVQTDVWSTWSGDEGGVDDALISTDYALSGTKSLKLEQTDDAGGPSDIILPIGITSGIVDIEFNYYIPNGMGGYFNFQESMQPAIGWSFELYFNGDGTISIIQDGADLGGGGTYTHDTWINIKIIADVDAGTGDIIINDVNIAQYMQDTMIGSINFYASGDAANGLYYIDDVSVDFTGVSVAELAAIEFGMFPNPASDEVSINLGSMTDSSIRVFDLAGKIVFQTEISGSGMQTFDISNLNQGIYLVQVSNNNNSSMKRLAVQK